MPTSYPTSVDSFTNPTPTNPMNSPSHSGEHSNANDAIAAVETHVGTTASPNFLPITGGTMSGAIAMGSNQINHAANGVASDDVATFGQIPANAAALLNAFDLASYKSQDTTGGIWVGGANTAAQGGATVGISTVKRSYTWLGSTSAADPGSGNFGTNSATFTSVTHVYISSTDGNGNDQSGWITQKVNTLIIYDDGSGNLCKGTITSIVNHSTWFDMTVTHPTVIQGSSPSPTSFNLYDYYLFTIQGAGSGVIMQIADVFGVSGQTLWSIAQSGTFVGQVTFTNGIVLENVNGVNGTLLVQQSKSASYTLTGQDSFIGMSSTATGDITITFPTSGLIVNTLLVLRNDNASHRMLFSGAPSGFPVALGSGQALIAVIRANGSPPTATILGLYGNRSDGWAAATSPTLGAAAQLTDKDHDANIYINVSTGGQITVAIGPTAGVADQLFNFTAPVGPLPTVHLPAGWYIAVTTSNTAVWSATAITC